MITIQEYNAILFYMGDQNIVDQEIYRGGNKAYNTINALLHQGIQNEIDKVNENRILEIYDSHHLQSYISLILDIYSAMIKNLNKENTHLITYRIDRYTTIETLKNKRFIEGFFSTCKYGYLEEYAHIKSNVILLEILRDKDVPYLDFEELFKDTYSKSEEAEILIPFNTVIDSIKEVELTEEEKKKYYDIHGVEPKGKYQIKCSKPNYEVDTFELINYNYLVDEEIVKRVKHCLNQIMTHKCLNEEDLEFYCNWKDKLHRYLRKEIIKKTCVIQ